MPTSPIVQLQLAIGVAAIALALWKGRLPERIAALVVLANLTAGLVLGEIEAPAEDLWLFGSDGVAAVILLLVTVRYGALWMGGAMFFYAAQFALYAAYMATGRERTDYLHAVINNINFSGAIFCLGAGAIAAWRRRVRQARSAAASSSPAPRR